MPATAAMLPDGRRLHLHHGPIDLIVDAAGPARAWALDRATARFATILDELAAELPRLRAEIGSGAVPEGEAARAMYAAVLPYSGNRITPMAAVAGAVADTVLASVAEGDLRTAYVNNGGDVALLVAPGESLTAAAGPADRINVPHESPVRGIATSGWRGRSHSLGIADSVTTLAGTAAGADAAATMIANAVDLPGHPAVRRIPACEIAPDSDLGDRPVTTGVGPLDRGEIDAALDRGRDFAERCRRRGLISGALLRLAGEARLVGTGGLAASGR